MKHFLKILIGRLLGIIILVFAIFGIVYGVTTLLLNNPRGILTVLSYLGTVTIGLLIVLVVGVILSYVLEYVINSFTTPLIKPRKDND